MLAKPEDIKSAFDQFKEPVKTTPVAIEAKNEEPIRMNARLNFQAVGVCPYCAKPMTRVQCCDQEVFLCEDDRMVTPLPNAEIK